MAAEAFTIIGRFAPPDFTPWIEGHARRLGVAVRFGDPAPGALAMQVDGPPDLIDAMEMGCLLGPQKVWVDAILRQPVHTENA